MAMKKKFLGLALAAAVALPATSVYAAEGYQTIQGEDNATLNHPVKVTGEVKTADGSAAAGKIEVELPTTMAFAVDQNSQLRGASYNVSNRSGCDIDVFVSSFSKTKGDITVKPMTEMDGESTLEALDRSNVALQLTGKAEGKQKTVDLGKMMTTGTEEKVLNIAKNSSETMTLSGVAGKMATVDPSDSATPTGVDKNGASADFTLVFKIKKDGI